MHVQIRFRRGTPKSVKVAWLNVARGGGFTNGHLVRARFHSADPNIICIDTEAFWPNMIGIKKMDGDDRFESVQRSNEPIDWEGRQTKRGQLLQFSPRKIYKSLLPRMVTFLQRTAI